MPSPATAQAGTLYGIGVGPGDVRYMTLRAAGLVRSVDVVAFFAKRGREGNARTHRGAAARRGAARDAARISGDRRDTGEPPRLQARHRRLLRCSADALAVELRAGSLGGVAGGGRSVLLRLVHAHVAAPGRRISGRGRARRHRHVGLLDARQRADHVGRRHAHRPAGHAGRGGAGERLGAPTRASS